MINFKEKLSLALSSIPIVLYILFFTQLPETLRSFAFSSSLPTYHDKISVFTFFIVGLSLITSVIFSVNKKWVLLIAKNNKNLPISKFVEILDTLQLIICTLLALLGSFFIIINL